MEVLQKFYCIICGTWVFSIFRYWKTAQISKVPLQQSLCMRFHPKADYWALGALTEVSVTQPGHRHSWWQRELFTAPSPLTSNLPQENQQQPQANSHFPAHLGVGFSTTSDILFVHVNGGKRHVCVESKQPIIHILLLVPLDEFNLLEKGFWLW